MKDAFKEIAINVTVPGQRHLGAVIGSREYVEEYVNDKVTNWISEITKLTEFADSASSVLEQITHYTYAIVALGKAIDSFHNNNIQLSPEGEGNSGGYIPRRKASRYIYPSLFTDPEGDSCFSIYQIRWIKKCCFNFFF